MSSLDAIAPFHADLTAIRRDIHAHPELGLDVPRTAALVDTVSMKLLPPTKARSDTAAEKATHQIMLRHTAK